MSVDRKTQVWEQIQHMKQSQDVDGLIEVLKREVRILSEAGARGYGHLSTSGVLTVGQFTDRLDANPFFEARFLIIEALRAVATIKSPKVFTLLTGLISQDLVWMEPAIGEEVARLLGETGDLQAVVYVAPLLRNESVYARASAADTLGKLGGDEAKGALLRAFRKEKDDYVRDRIREALVRIDPLMKESLTKQKTSWWKFW